MAANHTRWDSRGLSGVYRRLLDGGVDFVVVGGQAINLWAEHYQAAEEPPGAAWEAHLPFASGDLDLFGSTSEVLAAEAALGFTSERRADPFGKAWTPAAGIFHLPVGDGPDLMIHFLHTVHGLNSDDVELTAEYIGRYKRQPACELLPRHPYSVHFMPHPVCVDKLIVRLGGCYSNPFHLLFEGFDALARRVYDRRAWSQAELRW